MKYLPLVWAGIWRKPARTILIFFQVAVAFSLFGVLQGLKTGVDHEVAAARADLLLVHGSTWGELPLGMLEQITTVPGVKEVVPLALAPATYQNPKQQVLIVAVRPDKGWLSAFSYRISPEQAKAFRVNRTAMLVRPELAKKYGWKVGDRIPLMTKVAQRDGSTVWTFDMVGTFTDTQIFGGDRNVLVNYDYLNEARASDRGTVHHFNVAIADPRAAATVASAIDAKFANSPNETRSESIRALAQRNVQAIGDFEFLIRAVVAAVMAALLFATATMMIQSVRERTAEIAVLKTVGFTEAAVMALTLTESSVICLSGGSFGLVVAALAFPYASKFVHGVTMPWIIVIMGLVVAVLVALISAAVPAVLAARLEVATALAEQ